MENHSFSPHVVSPGPQIPPAGNVLFARQRRAEQLANLLTRMKQQCSEVISLIDEQEDADGEVTSHLQSILGSLTMNAICIETMMSYGEAFEERNLKLIGAAAELSNNVDQTIFKGNDHEPEQTS